MGRTRQFNTLTIALLVLALCASTGWAQIEQSIPAGASFVLRVHDASDNWKALRESGVLWQLLDPERFPEIAERVQQMQDSLETMRRRGVEPGALVRDLAGEDIALASDMAGQWLLLTISQSPARMQKAWSKLLDLAAESEDVELLEPLDCEGVAIQPVQASKLTYHAVVNGVFASTGDKGTMKSVIRNTVEHGMSIARDPHYDAADGLTPADAPITFFISRWGLEQLLGRWAEAPGQQPDLGRARLAALTPHTDFVTGWLTSSGSEVKIRWAWVFSEGRLPEMLRNTLSPSGSPLDPLRLAPPQAAFAMGRAFDPQGAWQNLVEATARTHPEKARQLQRGLQRTVAMLGGINSPEQFFSELGTQAGLFIAPPRKGHLVPGVGIAVHLRDTTHIPLALQTLAGLAAAMTSSHGDLQFQQETTHHKGTALHTYRPAQPPDGSRQGKTSLLGELSPTFGLVGHYMLFTTTLEIAQQAVDAAAHWQEPPRGLQGTPYSFVRLDLQALRSVLQRYSPILEARALLEGSAEVEATRKNLRSLQALLSLFDSAEFVAAFREGRTDHALRLRLPPVEKSDASRP